MKYQLKITGKGRHLNLSGDTVNELLDKVKEWQDWTSCQDHMEAAGYSPKKIAEEKASGFYYHET